MLGLFAAKKCNGSQEPACIMAAIDPHPEMDRASQPQISVAVISHRQPATELPGLDTQLASCRTISTGLHIFCGIGRHHLVCCKRFCSTQLLPGHINWIEGSIPKPLKLMGKNFECTALNVTTIQHWMWHSKLKWKSMLGQILTWWQQVVNYEPSSNPIWKSETKWSLNSWRVRCHSVTIIIEMHVFDSMSYLNALLHKSIG